MSRYSSKEIVAAHALLKLSREATDSDRCPKCPAIEVRKKTPTAQQDFDCRFSGLTRSHRLPVGLANTFAPQRVALKVVDDRSDHTYVKKSRVAKRGQLLKYLQPCRAKKEKEMNRRDINKYLTCVICNQSSVKLQTPEKYYPICLTCWVLLDMDGSFSTSFL
ncbi:hypothetical protein HDE_02685 [Halotydeus destructor]|nr:hypothetical protein HDE_02685 [Halotydeus destructor]